MIKMKLLRVKYDIREVVAREVLVGQVTKSVELQFMATLNIGHHIVFSFDQSVTQFPCSVCVNSHKQAAENPQKCTAG